MTTNRIILQRTWFGAGLCLAACLGLLVVQEEAALGSVARSKHDLSVSGTGNFTALSDSDICIFCHTPHRATIDSSNPPLWNRSLAPVSYKIYSSTTLKATVGQPNGASKLCLSCHDGTIALGMVNTRPSGIAMQGGAGTLTGPTLMGTDISGHHPVSFTYDKALADADGELQDPATLVNRVRLDQNHEVQCTSCHDPHNNNFGNFFVQDNTASALCLNCHLLPLYFGSVHATSAKTWNGAGPNPWPAPSATASIVAQNKARALPNTPAAHGCENCHVSHAAGSKARLLRYANDELNCYSCHAGSVATQNIRQEFNKPSVHPITSTTAVHDPMENPLTAPRHVKCVDCHNPHAARSGPAAQPPLASGSLRGVKGVNLAGTVVNTVTREYELCFRCHADSLSRGPTAVPRQFSQTNTRLQFAVTSASFHPVVTRGKNPNVPSLIPPYTTGSLIYCTDCHNNDQGPGAGGTGPRGPHGSTFPSLLERRLIVTDGFTETVNAYALCYKCHDRDRLLADQSFPHRQHVVDAKTSCATCHDPHGVRSKTSLVNFNSLYVTKSSNGRLEFNQTGTFQGNCSLTCHTHDHRASHFGN